MKELLVCPKNWNTTRYAYKYWYMFIICACIVNQNVAKPVIIDVVLSKRWLMLKYNLVAMWFINIATWSFILTAVKGMWYSSSRSCSNITSVIDMRLETKTTEKAGITNYNYHGMYMQITIIYNGLHCQVGSEWGTAMMLDIQYILRNAIRPITSGEIGVTYNWSDCFCKAKLCEQVVNRGNPMVSGLQWTLLQTQYWAAGAALAWYSWQCLKNSQYNQFSDVLICLCFVALSQSYLLVQW